MNSTDGKDSLPALEGIHNETDIRPTESFVYDEYLREGEDDQFNVFYGTGAGDNLSSTGYYNSFFGYQSGYNNSYADRNSSFGYQSGSSNISGNSNSFFGYKSGQLGNNLNYNSFFGCYSGQNTNGEYNSFFGYGSGKTNTTGSNNIFLGVSSGYNNISGDNNLFIGVEAGNDNENGSSNVFIGYRAGFHETGSNKLYIANSETSALIYGEFDNKLLKVNGSLELTSGYAASDRRWKKDINPLKDSLATVQKLEGVSYLWKSEEFPEKGFEDRRQIGLVAQEVEKIIPEVVKTDDEGYKSISYTQLIPVLIEAVKSQQKTIEEQKTIIECQQAQLGKQQIQIDMLMKKMDALAIPK